MRSRSLCVLLAVFAAGLVPGAWADEACEPPYAPFATVPGAELTVEDHVSKDVPPVRYARWRGTVPSFDGLPLSVDVTVPCDAHGPLGLVVMNHGWSDDKTIWQETGRSDRVVSEERRGSNSYWNNIWFASRGYAVLNFTARGWHDSCGPATPGAAGPLAPAPQCLDLEYWLHMADMRWEVRDMQWLTAGLVESSVADPDRLAVTGGSYGGGQTAMAALLANRTMCGAVPVPGDPCEGKANGDLVPWTTRDGSRTLQWAAALPLFTWSDLIHALLPNGRGSDGDPAAPPDGDSARPVGVPVQSFIAAIFAVGQPAGNGYYSPPGADPEFDLVLSTLRTLAGGPFIEADPFVQNGTRQLRDFRSPIGIEPVARVPIFWAQGSTDPLFTAFEPLRLRERILAHDPEYPFTLFVGDFGHDYAAERVDEWDLAHEQMNTFLDHHLGRSADASPDGITMTVTRCLEPDVPMEAVSAPDWVSLHARRLTFTSDEPRWTSSSVMGLGGLATDPVLTAALPGPQAYKGCRIMRPAYTDPMVASWTFALDEEITLLGSALVDLTYTTTSPDAQLNVRVWDVTPDQDAQALVTRGTFRNADGPGTALRARVQIAPAGYRFAAGHSIKVEVTGNDAPYRQANTIPGETVVERITLEVPAR